MPPSPRAHRRPDPRALLVLLVGLMLAVLTVETVGAQTLDDEGTRPPPDETDFPDAGGGIRTNSLPVPATPRPKTTQSSMRTNRRTTPWASRRALFCANWSTTSTAAFRSSMWMTRATPTLTSFSRSPRACRQLVVLLICHDGEWRASTPFCSQAS